MDETKKYDYNYEKINYFGIENIAGFDEAGRGAIAGPIVVAAVILPAGFCSNLIKDSKTLSFKQRNKIYQLILEYALDYSITIISVSDIEKMNPKNASVRGMEIAFQNLNIKPNVCLIDFESPSFLNFQGKMESLVAGDKKSINIAAASILAKVFRDKIMIDIHKEFPEYQFDSHKGYYTKLHASNLKTYGACKIHRKTYLPVRHVLK